MRPIKKTEYSPQCRSIDSSSILKVSVHILYRAEDFGGLIFNRHNHELFDVNELGYFILTQCNGLNSIEDIAENVCGDYDISNDSALNDIKSFATLLLEKEVLSFEEPE